MDVYMCIIYMHTGTDRGPIAEALEQMWTDAVGRDLQDLNLRQLTKEFSKLVYAYPIRVPERFALVIRTLLTQVLSGSCVCVCVCVCVCLCVCLSVCLSI